MPQTITKSCLSEHDQQVLNSVFNPLELTSSLAPGNINPHSSIPLVDNDDENCDVKILENSKILELEGVKFAEAKDFDKAVEKFNEALNLTPNRASIYNNRAQALRLAGRDEEALQDLNVAIEYADVQYKTKCHALCQRGVLYRKQNKLSDAKIDFEEAAKMGSEFAKTQLVEINPFAALCNQMLREAFVKLK
uniref:TPR repeat-containing protein n=1 Tax=Glossina morsitans morsitans TaxID=37546 RepID=D3TQG0_GLOMM